MDEAPQTDEAAERRAAMKRLAVFFGLSLLFVGLSLLTPAREWFSVERLSELSRRLGYWGPVLILVVGIITPVLFLPRWPVAFVCGMLYGLVWGSALANVASLLGAWLHFVLSKSLLAPMSARLLRRRNGDRLTIPRRHAFAGLFFLRAFPLSNFVATNLLAGSLRIPTGTYLSATFLGMIPSTLMYAAWGKLMKQPSKGFYWLIAAVMLVLIVGTGLARKKLGTWKAERTENGPETAG